MSWILQINGDYFGVGDNKNMEKLKQYCTVISGYALKSSDLHDQDEIPVVTTMDIVKSMFESPDIHHIFPEAYCIKQNYPKAKWNFVIN